MISPSPSPSPSSFPSAFFPNKIPFANPLSSNPTAYPSAIPVFPVLPSFGPSSAASVQYPTINQLSSIPFKSIDPSVIPTTASTCCPSSSPSSNLSIFAISIKSLTSFPSSIATTINPYSRPSSSFNPYYSSSSNIQSSNPSTGELYNPSGIPQSEVCYPTNDPSFSSEALNYESTKNYIIIHYLG
jgi:hypothetical protein